MKLLPDKTSKSLMRIMGYYFSILYAVLLLSHAILKSQFTARSLFGLASLALVSAMAAGLGFWLEGRLFFFIYSASLAASIFYILYVVIANATPGWGDLTSLAGFMLISAAGMVLGLAAEFVRYLLKPRLKQEKRNPA
jgi:hypothetical protein